MNKMNVCSEIFGLINILDIDDIDKLPRSFLNIIIENKNISYNPTYNSFKSFFEDDYISQESKIIILYCYYKYLCENTQDKYAIKKILNENDINDNSINYKSIDNLFDKSNLKNYYQQEEKSLMGKKKWYIRISSSIKKMFVNKIKIFVMMVFLI